MKRIKVSGTYSLPLVIKAEWTSYVVFSIFFLPLSILWLIITLGDPSSWPGLLGALFLLFGFLSWVGSFKIILGKDKLVYKTLFSRKKELFFSDIIRIKQDVSYRRKSSAAGYYSLSIYDNSSFSKVPLMINMKPFSQRNLAIVVDAITDKSSSVEMDKSTRALKERNFEPVISAGIRNIWPIALSIFSAVLAIGLIRALIRLSK